MNKHMHNNTKDIVCDFITTFVRQRGHPNWKPPKRTLENGSKVSKQEQIELKIGKEVICQSLIELSNQVQDFIEEKQNETFTQMLNSIEGEEITYKKFRSLADELFSEGISWFKISTLLVFCGAVVCRTIDNESDDEGDDDLDEEDDEYEHKVNLSSIRYTQTVDCVTEYIDKFLLDWIEDHRDGWLSVKEYTINDFNNSDTKGMKHYFRIATYAAFVGGLYFCSKFILQK